MNKKAKNISELMNNVGLKKSTKESVEKEKQRRSLSNLLTIIRCDHNLTQKQLAKKIGCHQSKISKVESSYDEDIKIDDLLKYAKALNLQLGIGFNRKKAKIADLIKYHLNKTQQYYEKLVKLAQDDPALDAGVGEFIEAMSIKSIKVMAENISKLDYAKKYIRANSRSINISPPLKIENSKKSKRRLSKTN